MSANQLALALRVPTNRITAILKGERSVQTAVRKIDDRQDWVEVELDSSA